MSALLQPLTEPQQKLLELVAAAQQEHRAAPVWSYLEHELDKVDLDAAQVLDSLPIVGRLQMGNRHYGLTWTESNIPMPATRVYLTVAGRHRVQGVEISVIDAFMFLLKKLVTMRLQISMSPVEVKTVYATRRDLQARAPDPNVSLLTPGMIDEIKTLVDHEPVLMGTVSGDDNDPGGWKIELRRELALYKNIDTVDQYIRRTTAILTPRPPEPVDSFPSPLGVASAFDYLDVVWQLNFTENLVQPISAERTARLALPVNTQEELSAQLSALGELLKGFRVPRKPREHPVQGIIPHLEQHFRFDEPALDRLRAGVAILEAVVHLRNAQQHGGGQTRAPGATNTLGLVYPVGDPSHAWQMIQNRIIAALTAIREEIRSASRPAPSRITPKAANQST